MLKLINSLGVNLRLRFVIDLFSSLKWPFMQFIKVGFLATCESQLFYNSSKWTFLQLVEIELIEMNFFATCQNFITTHQKKIVRKNFVTSCFGALNNLWIFFESYGLRFRIFNDFVTSQSFVKICWNFILSYWSFVASCQNFVVIC